MKHFPSLCKSALVKVLFMQCIGLDNGFCVWTEKALAWTCTGPQEKQGRSKSFPLFDISFLPSIRCPCAVLVHVALVEIKDVKHVHQSAFRGMRDLKGSHHGVYSVPTTHLVSWRGEEAPDNCKVDWKCRQRVQALCGRISSAHHCPS